MSLILQPRVTAVVCTIDRAVSSAAIRPDIKSRHRQFFVKTFDLEKTKTKKDEVVNGPTSVGTIRI